MPIVNRRDAIPLLVVLSPLLSPTPLRAGDTVADSRKIQAGRPIPDEGYCDQPYVILTDDGQWLCVMTTGRGVEGLAGQHIVSSRRADRGRTWSEHVPIEPADGPEASWDSDPGTGPGTLEVGAWRRVTVTVDGGPKIISFLVDGVLNDGGTLREYGWGRFRRDLSDLNGSAHATLGTSLLGQLRAFRIYERALRTSEAVGNSRE